MIRAFLDTNVLVSAILFGSGPPRELFRRAAQGEFLPCLSEQVLQELELVLRRPRIKKSLAAAYAHDEIITLLHDLTEGSLVNFGDVEETDQVPTDAKDNHILSAALQMQVDYLVSGDRDVLDLRAHSGLQILDIRIVTPRELLDVWPPRHPWGDAVDSGPE